MTWFQAVILGIIEGLTEFLPVSSTGHLILAAHVLRIPDTPLLATFEVSIQVGAIAAVALLYAKRVMRDRALLAKVAVAFVPTALLGILAYPLVKGYLLGNATVTVAALGIGGAALIAFDWLWPPTAGNDATPTYRQAAIIGAAQAAAFVPGVSRAAAAIIGGAAVGLSRRSAVEFSFLLAVPTILAAAALDLVSNAQLLTAHDLGIIALGAGVAFITALAVIATFLRLIARRTFAAFGAYRIALAALFAIFFL